MQQIANDPQPFLEFDQLRRCSSETVDRPVTGAQTDDGAASGDFIQRGEGIGDDGGIAIDHIGDRRAEADLFRFQRAHRHDLVWIDIVHVTVGEENRLKTEGFSAVGAIDRFLNTASRAVKTKLNRHS